MSIYTQVESGTSFHRSRFSKSISNRMDYDCQFHQLVPVLKRFVLPGDIWRIGGDVLVRFQPMLSPTLTPNSFRVRYFFVPLRLVEPNAELVITGSKDGHLYSGELPVLDNFVAKADKTYNTNAYKVLKHSFWDYMNVQPLDYEAIKSDEVLPAAYWSKAWQRIKWDYYFDENLQTERQNYADFDAFETDFMKNGAAMECGYSNLKKDYFISSLPWQLKGVAPVIQTQLQTTFTGTWNPNFTGDFIIAKTSTDSEISTLVFNGNSDGTNPHFNLASVNANQRNAANSKIRSFLNGAQTVSATASGSSIGFSADDLRTMMAQTRIFERLARAGSRYTEYLRSNFGTAPADDTLQRAQYLGGWKVPIVTTEVLQTAEGTDPVGTMRGHGITRGGNRIATFYAKEFGVLFGVAEVRPDVQYTTGINRQLTYKRRFDFFNPSLQHLSEQEVRNGELFISNSDGLNDSTFGFQAYGNELRSYENETVGEMRDTLGYWNQALQFTARPNLNSALISGKSHRASFNRPFGLVDPDTAYPIIVQFYNNLDVYRPMVRYATPGLVDHL